jgi:hypothetical protein
MESPLSKIRSLLDQGDFDAFCKKFRGIDVEINYNFVSISDTIVIYSFCKETDVEVALDGHGKIANYFVLRGMEHELLLRGATSVGNFEMENRVFVGRAIDEAASWYERCDWMGVIMTPTADYKYRQLSILSEQIWVEYQPNYKNIPSRNTFCVNWVKENKYSVESLMNYFIQFSPITTDIGSKFDNTLAFLCEIVNRSKNNKSD